MTSGVQSWGLLAPTTSDGSVLTSSGSTWMSSGRRLDASEMVNLKGGFHQSGAGGVRTSAGVQRWPSA